MKTLEARFHPPPAAKEVYVVVARIIWDGGEKPEHPRIEPQPTLSVARAPATILATLRHLVLKTAPASFERLLGLRSNYWSFVAVAPPAVMRDA